MSFAAFLRKVVDQLDASGIPYIQIRDVYGVLAIQRGALDEVYMRRAAGALGVSETLERLLREARRSG